MAKRPWREKTTRYGLFFCEKWVKSLDIVFSRSLYINYAEHLCSQMSAKEADQRKRKMKTNEKTRHLNTAPRAFAPGGAKMRVETRAGRVIDARQRFAALRRGLDSGALPPTPGGRQRVCATFTKPPKDLIARSKNTMRREIINQGLMYAIISLFVFAMIPLLRFLS